MNIGSLLSGAGRVSTGVREREEELRRARLQQLVVEDANRRAANARRQATAPIPEVPTFGPDRQPQGVGIALPPATPVSQPQRPGVAVPPAQNPTTTAGKVPQSAPAPVEKPPMTQAEFLALPPERRAEILQTINDRRLLKSAVGFPAAGAGAVADLATAPYRGYAMAAEGIANSRIGRALGITDPGQRMEVFGSGTASGLTGDEKSFPLAAKGSRMITDNMLPWTEEDYLKTLPATNAQKNPRRGGPARKKNLAGGVEAPATTDNVPANIAQYDKPTKYDGLIEQAAAANGLDPVVFKRLLGTESSFRADAVSPRGASYGLGIGQIAASWGLSDAERLDPTIAIPKAAEILAQYVEAAGGDYREGMMKYKGASSEKGRASMAPIIDGILSGLQAPAPVATLTANDGPALREAIAAGGQRPAGVQRTPAQAPTYDPEFAGGQTRSPAQFYLGNPQALGHDIRTAMMQREELVRMAKFYQQDGMGAEYTQMRQQIMALDSQMASLAGIQAVQQMEYSGNPVALSKMLSYFQDQQIDLKPYTDGSFDILIDGVVRHERVPGWLVKDQALSLFDPEYRKQKSERNAETHKANLQTQGKVDEQTAQMIRELTLAQFNGTKDLAIERLKLTGKGDWDVKPLGDGTVAFVPLKGGIPFIWSPEGRTVKIDGQEYTVNSAQPVAGLR